MQIRLFTSIYLESNPLRAAELGESLERNLKNPQIDEVCLFVENSAPCPPNSPKIRIRSVGERPKYSDYFDWIREIALDSDISIVANGDIWFDEQLGVFRVWRQNQSIVFALSRWESATGEGIRLNDRGDSQDSWIFFGPVKELRSDFPLGVPRCDNRIAKELEAAGYNVQNPSFSIISNHLHSGIRAEYATENESGFVAGPYKYLWPHNLWTLPFTIFHNLAHPECRVRWRFDSRQANRMLRLHWLRQRIRRIRD
jgi:hypothetical protein